MRLKNLSLVLLIIVFVSNNSCSKRIVPSELNKMSGKEYDAASFNYLYVEAIKQKLMGNSGDALRYFEQCVVLNPQSDASYYQMAQIVLAGGDLSSGKSFTKRALDLDNDNLWYLMMMAGIYFQEQNIDSAIFYYEKASVYFPDNETLMVTLGNLYSENGNFQKAIDLFDSLDKKFGVNEVSTISTVKNLMGAGKFDDALIRTKLLLEQSPDEILYNGLLAEIYRGKGENDKAMEVYSKLIARNPDNPQTQLAIMDFLITEKRYDELFAMLNSVIVKGNISRDDVISLMARLIEIPEFVKEKGDNIAISLMIVEAANPEDDIIPLLRPELFTKQNKLNDAARRLEEIIDLNKNNYFAWERLLFVYLQQGDYKVLMTKGEECATRFNRSFLAKILYANGAIEMKKYDIALSELKKAEILAGDEKEQLDQVVSMRADTYYRMKEYQKAFDVFEQAIQSDRTDLTIMNNYAYYLAEQNVKLKQAEVLAKEVIGKEKDNNTFLDTYAWVLYKRGKTKEAARVMEQIIGSGEKANAEWFEHYGFILKKQRKYEKAIENWKYAIELDNSKTHLLKEIEDCKK